MRQIYEKTWKRLAREQTRGAISLVRDGQFVGLQPEFCEVCGYMMTRGVKYLRAVACNCPALGLCFKYVEIINRYNRYKEHRIDSTLEALKAHLKELRV